MLMTDEHVSSSLVPEDAGVTQNCCTVQHQEGVEVMCPTNDTTDMHLTRNVALPIFVMFQQALEYMNETCSRFCLLVIVTFLHFIFYM